MEATTTTAADKCDQRRSVNGTHSDRPRDPSPARADLAPAAVVKGSESPRGVIDPSPTPGSDPYPVTKAIGCPACRNVRGIPHRTVVSGVRPASVVVQIFIA